MATAGLWDAKSGAPVTTLFPARIWMFTAGGGQPLRR